MKKKLVDLNIQNSQKSKKKKHSHPDYDDLNLRRTEPLHFEPGFADRVTARIRDMQENVQDDFFASMLWAFKRIALTAAVAALVLFSFSLFSEPIDMQQLYYASSEVSLDELANPTVTWSLEEM